MARVKTTPERPRRYREMPSGRRTWKAAVTLPEAGAVDFVFDVLY
jgi:hypothetical protein